MAFPTVEVVESYSTAHAEYDAVILVGDFAQAVPAEFADFVERAKDYDQRVGKQPLLVAADVFGGRLITAPTGPLTRDFDDVRAFSDAAGAGARIAQQAGVTKPLLVVFGTQDDARYGQAEAVAYWGFCQALYEPLEAREALGEESIETITGVGVLGTLDSDWLAAVEAGKRVARDLCGTEPERMAPPRFAEYCQQAFAHTPVKVTVIDDIQQLQHEYPLLMAVGRASLNVERHWPCVIRLEYNAPAAEQTLMFAGKGIVYDTGGADLKIGGHMAGMSRDKGGAAGVAGFVKTVAEMRPDTVSVVAELGVVRNSIGAEAFVADEIIKAHSGVRVRIGNTDAEGRLVLADLLSHLRVQAGNYPRPQLFSVATLTGHAALAKGPYSALVPNGPARAQGLPDKLWEAGEVYGDPTEISWSRREDFAFVAPRTKSDDVLSSNNGPSATTRRGHQFPMAFLTIAAGLDGHGNDSDHPIPYVHVDIAGSGIEGGDWQHGKPSGAPVTCFAGAYLHK
ncbi:leucyl aminopeptidase family protein [Pseudidiomarina sp. 1APR75-33.1]|uniref:M17 family metallopeptidase n=1 Tax=Pseudidiomarina terrestris TaxID=2820060 RepID=UPI00264FF4C5|nr:leucyl aminopeptidase family protein [Pseudidiomarina sp. 1APR75-33.1]MDN7126768.1 leucyl aminopeptidase family protein [Pseudidiomarina sp. 1APR75-33.1]